MNEKSSGYHYDQEKSSGYHYDQYYYNIATIWIAILDQRFMNGID